MTDNLPETTQDSFLTVIAGLASNPEIDVEKISRMMDMQERILDRNAKQAFNVDMMNAQAEIPIVPTDARNQQTNSDYSLYKTILKFAKPIYTKHGFSVMFYEGFDSEQDSKWPKIPEGEIRTFADIMHREGHTKTVYIDMPTDDKGIKGTVNKTQPHAKKSSVSYSRGTLLCMIFNIPTGVDDDGNAAGTPVEYINDKQLSTIVDLINEKEVDEIKFCQWMKAEKVESILAKDFGKAINALKSKKKPERQPGDDS